MTKKRILYFTLTAIVALLSTTFICNKIIDNAAEGKVFTATGDIAFNKVGLLLGTSKYTVSGRDNPFYVYRIRAAAELMKAGKIKYLIVSGDNGNKAYDEPTSMRSDLMSAGIDSTLIFLDYAGFRTFDSMKRLKEIFNQDSVTVISQKFHNERAIYIANRLGITAIGFNAKDVSQSVGFQTMIREKFARTKVFIDFLLGTKPKYLGKKVVIPL